MKKIKYFIYLILISIIIHSNCYAFNAYSVGSKYAVGVTHAGDDFTTNVKNAASAYKTMSGCNSYQSLISSYDYMRGSRLGSSRVYFINGHANYDRITTAGYDKDNYRTGISIYNDGYAYNDNLGDKWIFAGLNGRDMSGTRLITFAGCSTAEGTNNLTAKAVQQGAKAAVGFSGSITSRFYDGPKWLNVYNIQLANNASVHKAVQQATLQTSNSDLRFLYRVHGDSSITLNDTKSGIINSFSAIPLTLTNEEREALIPIEKVYKVLDIETDFKIEMSEKNEINYSNESIKQIIDIIKKDDIEFNIEDYKLTYNIINEKEGFGQIFLRYYINKKIETNKEYVVTIYDNIVDDITLAGVKKSNISKIKEIEEEKLYTRVAEFEKNKKKESLYNEIQKLYGETYKVNINNILTSNNEINLKTINSNIQEYKEKYYYDYNIDKLSYQVIIHENLGEIDLNGKTITQIGDGEAIEIGID